MTMHDVPPTGWHERRRTIADHHRPDPFTAHRTTTEEPTMAVNYTHPTRTATPAVSLIKRPRINYTHPSRVTAPAVRTDAPAVSYVHPMRTASPAVARAARSARTITLYRAARLAAAHGTTVTRLFVDYPPMHAAVDGDVSDDYARVPLAAVVTALGY